MLPGACSRGIASADRNLPETDVTDDPSFREHLMICLQDLSAALVVSVRGEIDMATAPQLRSTISTAITRLGGKQLVLDLRAVEFLGLHGLHVLAETAREVTSTSAGSVRVVVEGGRVRRTIELAGLDGAVEVHELLGDPRPFAPSRARDRRARPSARRSRSESPAGA
jgi:anti-sigma B factor antagonist